MNKRHIFQNAMELRRLTCFILKGMSYDEISRELNYSRSTVAYKINYLFRNFNAKNRTEFILSVVNKIIFKKDETIQSYEEKNKDITFENEKLKNLLNNIIKNENEITKLKYWLNEAKKILFY